jgi:hypothetical protein
MWQELLSNIFSIFHFENICHKVNNAIFLLFIAHMVYNLYDCQEYEI